MKMLEKIKSNSWWISIVLVLVIFLRQCGVNSDVDRIEKGIKTLNISVDSLQKISVTKSDLEKSMNQTMFNFLIYEDDFDKGKSSLSDIKSKIDQTK
jgi:hypothetical protein